MPSQTLPCHVAWTDRSEYHLTYQLLAVVCKLFYATYGMCQQDLILLCQSQQLLLSPSLHANLPVASLKGKQCMCSLKLRLKLHGKKMTGAAVIFLTKFGHCGYETWELAQETHSAERWFVPQSSCTKGGISPLLWSSLPGELWLQVPEGPLVFCAIYL